MTRQAELCRYQLPNGKTCRQITLRGEYLCRHHRRLFHKDETEMIQQEAMESLASKLASLELPALLYALYGKLSRIRTTVRSHPEAQLALEITLHRLLEEIVQVSHPGGNPPTLSTPMNFPENLIESMNYNGNNILD